MNDAPPGILGRTRVGFGRHRGKTWTDVVRQDPGYVRWWLREADNPERIGAGVVAALRKATADQSPTPHDEVARTPVEWRDSGARAGYFAEYVTCGAMPGILLQSLPSAGGDAAGIGSSLEEQATPVERLGRFLSQSVFLTRSDRGAEGSDEARFAASLVVKLLVRGRTPLPTLGVEREAIRLNGPFDSVRSLDAEDPDVGWHSEGHADPEAVLSAAIGRNDFALDPEFDLPAIPHSRLMGSEAEARFLKEWVPRELGPSAGHWFTPQAPLGTLLEAAGVQGSSEEANSEDAGTDDARRVDFLFCHPCAPSQPVAIEIDGPQHREAVAVDRERDRALRAAGIDVLRVSTEEVTAGSGPGLARVRERLGGLFTAGKPSATVRRYAALAVDCADAARVQRAVADALWRGWLRPGACWNIRIKGARSPSASGVVDLLDMLRALEVIYGVAVAPRRCSVALDDGKPTTWVSAESESEDREASSAGSGTSDRLTISVESSRGPFHATRSDDSSDCIIRSTFLPVTFVTPPKLAGGARRPAAAQDYEEESPLHHALRLFLRHLYRKREFLEGQGKGLHRALRHFDTIILLPTGGGKSIIYQLAGLLMPGVTLVVDPLIALMEDQVEGLALYGIDRAVPIFQSSPATQKRKLRLVEMGQYHFVLVSPERLQSPHFREAVQALAVNMPINLAVIDEAHCVSEWGHDFRPAYLSLANSLRTFTSSRDDVSPPLLALTGTASRAVLRDMINDLEIDRNTPDAVIRPESFDRTEISFTVINTNPAHAKAKLRAVLNGLPGQSGIPLTEYYRPRGRPTNSGIVFVPTVNGRTGIDEVVSVVKTSVRNPVTFYSGKAPKSVENEDWDRAKRQNARKFKQNEVPVLVATKAFGMGIDKPNIRFTIHYGVPSSLEQYYQEAGRAGRDRQRAFSTLILGELSNIRSDQLLDPDLELEELRRQYNQWVGGWSSRDDITRSLYFHLNGFPGASSEIEDVRELAGQVIDQPAGIPKQIPFGNDRHRQRLEKAIYRLYRLGFVGDYAIDFGRRAFEVVTTEFDFGRVRRRLLANIRNVAPGKLAATRRRIAEVDPAAGKREALVGLAAVLIEFAYDEIERARRRAIQEAILLARQCRTDADVQKRLLDYLQEGVGYERIDELLRREEVDLREWIDLADKVGNPIEAGELRGMCIRALESSPDHPGLLLIRGVVETMAADYYWNAAATNIARAISVGLDKYDISEEHIEGAAERLFGLASMGGAEEMEGGKRAWNPLLRSLCLTCLRVADTGSRRMSRWARALGHVAATRWPRWDGSGWTGW